MDAFNPIPPEWVEKATHATGFCFCPNTIDRSYIFGLYEYLITF